jgi:DNA-binding winged helix-turn-helix (wHTH) protein
MIFRFGDFELDEACREVRFRRQPLSLQPRVFDLLAFLIRNRHRVVQKDELLETLWQGTVVGDGSLQRAVSLARAALKPGGMDRALRNYSRQGYRFCCSDELMQADRGTPSEQTDGTHPSTDYSTQPQRSDDITRSEQSDDARSEQSYDVARSQESERDDTKLLADAHRALARRDWDAAAALFVEADRHRALQASDLERLAEAHECAGRMHESLPLLERAAAANAARGDARGVARSALRLASLEFDSGRLNVARGWLNHGIRHLTGMDESWEHGFAECVKARVGIASGDPESAATAGRTAVDVGRRLGSEDIVAIGLL